jgi:hypothetical protein
MAEQKKQEHLEELIDIASKWHDAQERLNILNQPLGIAAEHRKDLIDYCNAENSERGRTTPINPLTPMELLVPMLQEFRSEYDAKAASYLTDNLDDILHECDSGLVKKIAINTHPAKEFPEKFKDLHKLHKQYAELATRYQIAASDEDKSGKTDEDLRKVVIARLANKESERIQSEFKDYAHVKKLAKTAAYAATIYAHIVTQTKAGLLHEAKSMVVEVQTELEEKMNGNELEYASHNLAAMKPEDAFKVIYTIKNQK